jgi:hypothetical protein
MLVFCEGGGVIAVCDCDVTLFEVGRFKEAAAPVECGIVDCGFERAFSTVRALAMDCRRGRGTFEDSVVRNSRICALCRVKSSRVIPRDTRSCEIGD